MRTRTRYTTHPKILDTSPWLISEIVFLRIAGVGHHVPAVYLEDPDKFMVVYSNFLKCTFALQVLYFFAVGLPKLSILFLYLRLFSQIIFRRITYFVMFIVEVCTYLRSHNQGNTG